MTSLNDRFGAPKRERPAPATPDLADVLWLDTGYGAKALREEAALLAAKTEPGRNDLLNDSAFKMFQIVDQGLLEEQVVRDSLTEAAHTCGLTALETHNTLDSARKATPGKPREPIVLHADRPRPAASGLVDAHGAPLSTEQGAADRHARAVAFELARIRVNHDAKTAHRAELAAGTWREPPSTADLAEELALPVEEVTWAVQDMLPAGGNALLVASYKAGKTTLCGAYVKSHCDDVPFLGKYAVTPAEGRVAVFNYELSRSQYNQWLRELRLQHPERACVLHLRGFRVPVTSPDVETWVAQWLADHQVSAWVVDPFARAFTGCGEENDNTAVGLFLDTLDVIKARAGVRDLLLPVHTGRIEAEKGAERARGATRLDDWADVRWLLTKDDEGNRFLRATGRDVETEEEQLHYDEPTRSLRIGGGDRAWVKRRHVEEQVVDFVAGHPGATSTEVETAIPARRESVRSALSAAVFAHRLRVELAAHNTRRHYAT